MTFPTLFFFLNQRKQAPVALHVSVKSKSRILHLLVLWFYLIKKWTGHWGDPRKSICFSLYTHTDRHTGRQTDIHTTHTWTHTILVTWMRSFLFCFVSVTILFSPHRFRRSETSLVYELAWTSSSCSFSSYLLGKGLHIFKTSILQISIYHFNPSPNPAAPHCEVYCITHTHTHMSPPLLSTPSLKVSGPIISPFHPICKMKVSLTRTRLTSCRDIPA